MPRKSTKTTKTVRHTAPKKAFLFFNCDAEKSQNSMNVLYNQDVYKDTIASRKALWSKVEDEIAAGRVNVAEENLAAAKEAVLKGDPVEAGQFLEYGTILAFACH
ncbi:MAG: hypothetical protein SOV43_02570 [Selenomonadaceae bacterium]|nr:hypothetical protein [Selenomonadaceae bacterium]MDY2685044.1 hypothetical protein [Selenomonadaceae bacterium]